MSLARYPVPVKRTRHTRRPSAPFGAGILPRFSLFAVTASGFSEPSEADRVWAAGVYGEDGTEPDPDWEALALQAAWDEQFQIEVDAKIRCRNCLCRDDFVRSDGLCPPCALEEDAAV